MSVLIGMQSIIVRCSHHYSCRLWIKLWWSAV